MYRLLSGLHAHLTRKEEFNVIILGLDHAGKTTLLEKVKTVYTPSRPGLNPSQISPTIGQNIGRITLSSTYLQFWDLGGSHEIRPIWEKYYGEADAVCWVIDSWDRTRNSWTSDAGTGSGPEPNGKGKGKAKDRIGNIGSSSSGDPSSLDRRGEGWVELEKVLSHPLISHSNIPVLIIANKQDHLPSATQGQSQGSSSSHRRGPMDQRLDTLAPIDEEPEERAEHPMPVEEIKEMFNRLVMESERSEKARSLGLSEAQVLGVSALSGQGIQEAVNWLFYRVAAKGKSRKSLQQDQQLRANLSIEPARSQSPSNNPGPNRLADLGKPTGLRAPVVSRSGSYQL